jgi:hypothetical protein
LREFEVHEERGVGGTGDAVNELKRENMRLIMETVRDVKMKLYIQTDKRTIEEEFQNLLDMRMFMDRFFAQAAERRSAGAKSGYAGPERRMRL